MNNRTSNIKAYEAALMPKKLIGRLTWLLKEYIPQQTGEVNGHEVFKTIYQVADEFMAIRVEPYASCSKGCSMCCHVPVELPALEAMYIADMTETALNIGPNEGTADTATPCPFLEHNLCSIYAHRPLACRLFATLEPVEMCNGNKQKHAMHCVKSSDYWLKGVMAWIILNSQGRTIGTLPIPLAKDVREWFPVNR